ncbi:MAG: hypothetical protein LUB59_03905 [Candidatus Gastranaerophilales bacterium]|nr:hypothetical protein [Candidatus Gastranaerophilales bacterium]
MELKKVYQMFILGVGNLEYVLKNDPGGVIFFSDDILSTEQFISLIENIKSKVKIPLFLTIDQEGGRVERTWHLHARYLPARNAFKKGLDFLKNQTEKIAEELCTYGINMNFAPCLDVNTNPDNPIIGDRAFSDNPYEVCIGYDIEALVYNTYNIIPVIKHFPGHGDTSKDSHLELPGIDLSLDEMEKVHIMPFKHAIKHGAEAVMAAHIHCSCFDNEEIPASLSKNVIGYLRNNLNFNGLIISDDMIMKGVAKYGMSEACIMGIKAGINMFIYRNSADKTLQVIEDVIKAAENDSELRDRIEDSFSRIIDLKCRHNIITDKKSCLSS